MVVVKIRLSLSLMRKSSAKGFKAILLKDFDGKIWENCGGLCLEV